jgi:methyltransferase
MVTLHTGLLAACLVEAIALHRPFIPALGWLMLTIVVAAQGLRWWCIATLGRQWNTRVVVVPGAARVARGPYRFLPHPNYVAVVAEGVALPLVHTAWITAFAFSVLNAALMTTRIKVENAALASLT